MRLVGDRVAGRRRPGPDRDRDRGAATVVARVGDRDRDRGAATVVARVGNRDRDRDRGAATVVACVGAVVLLVVTGLAVHAGAVMLARQRAETGADLAALAGAAQLLRGVEVACAAADQVARANGVGVTGCRTDGLDLLVEVVAAVGGAFGGSAAGRARAGPAGPDASTGTG